MSARKTLAPLPGAVMPSVGLLRGHRYTPSWADVPRTTWTDRLGGHYGPVDTHAALRGKR